MGSPKMIYAYRKSDFNHINIELISYGDNKFEKLIQINVVMLSRDPSFLNNLSIRDTFDVAYKLK